MHEPLDLAQIFHLYRRELGYSFIATLTAVVRHWQCRDPWREICFNGVLVAIVAFGLEGMMSFYGIDSGKWGYLVAVWLGYVGVAGFIDGISARIPFLTSSRKGEHSDVQTGNKK